MSDAFSEALSASMRRTVRLSGGGVFQCGQIGGDDGVSDAIMKG